jgi:hypothetical protein
VAAGDGCDACEGGGNCWGWCDLGRPLKNGGLAEGGGGDVKERSRQQPKEDRPPGRHWEPRHRLAWVCPVVENCQRGDGFVDAVEIRLGAGEVVWCSCEWEFLIARLPR